ncbi:transposase [Patescibacteria group bacterium]|nr:transposase [Patescibacteria group bacterium]MBU1448680.1 transposase [Patescibacteria group bacterium]MBU2613262.1 transposase [Patescibacteria group bacterium]
MDRRRSVRLTSFDYASPGAYFVTICTYDRRCLFGDVVDGDMRRNEVGAIVTSAIRATPAVRKEIRLDTWIVMPNHIHLIVWFVGRNDGSPHPVGADGNPPSGGMRSGQAHYHAPLRRQARSLSSFVAGLKRISTMNIRRHLGIAADIWQRGYHEHVIRDDEELDALRSYVINNALKWEKDPEHPTSQGGEGALPCAPTGE